MSANQNANQLASLECQKSSFWSENNADLVQNIKPGANQNKKVPFYKGTFHNKTTFKLSSYSKQNIFRPHTCILNLATSYTKSINFNATGHQGEYKREELSPKVPTQITFLCLLRLFFTSYWFQRKRFFFWGERDTVCGNSSNSATRKAVLVLTPKYRQREALLYYGLTMNLWNYINFTPAWNRPF